MKKPMFLNPLLFIWFAVIIALTTPSYNIAWAQATHTPLQQLSEILLSKQNIDQLANTAPAEDGSVENNILSLNPTYSGLAISRQDNTIKLHFTLPTFDGDKSFTILTNPQMWQLEQQGVQPPTVQERITGWLMIDQQPYIKQIESLQKGKEILWKVTVDLNEATAADLASAAAQPPNDTAQPAPAENDSGPGFGQRIMSSSLVVNFKKGGFIMYLILLCSIGGLYIALERGYVLRRSRLIPEKFVQDVLKKFTNNKERDDIIHNIVDMCEGMDIPAARTLKAGLMVYKEGMLGAKSAITSANSHEGAIMERGVGLLGVLANISPLLGLLGTVTGMIKAFEMISVGGSGRAEVVASGISEALITTAGGLFVGIPLLLLYFFFQGKIDEILIDLEEFSLEIIEKLMARSDESGS
jgi:biopolymer transport protein ExbB